MKLGLLVTNQRFHKRLHLKTPTISINTLRNVNNNSV